ncbi:hypothetical protein EUX98_g6174 [Antrodiella citrinella]|uniref:Membrane-associated proteins in eicosanoid and glutathione metabolism n=1 Tax=Antrodiella citrinella TaxID=2447956 RepID=A0A4S4MRU6_9APHY|nr:hypothetical protein EUX98_g6174 [Antrodiella citrinella]
MVSITITPEYGYVGAALVSTFYVTIFQMITVGRARKAAGIKYPQLYAEKAEVEASEAARIFNCAQRAHANTLEQLPMAVVATVVASAKYPTYAAAALALWSVGRIFYTLGYTTGKPEKRNNSITRVGSFAGSVLLLGATYTSLQIALGW